MPVGPSSTTLLGAPHSVATTYIQEQPIISADYEIVSYEKHLQSTRDSKRFEYKWNNTGVVDGPNYRIGMP